MKPAPKQRNKKNIKISNSLSNKPYMMNSKSINDSFQMKENKIKGKVNQNNKLKSDILKQKDNQIKPIYFKKIKTEKLKIKERSESAKPIPIQARENKYNQKIYDKIIAFKKSEKNKIRLIRTNSAFSKKIIKSNNNKEITQQKIPKSLYLNEKDLFDLEKDIKNSLYEYINILHINGEIELEIINIIKNFKNTDDKKHIYKKLFELFNNIFEQINFFSKNEIKFFIKNELNKLAQKSIELLLSIYSIFFINIILLSINDSISIINTHYENLFIKISKIIYNIYDKFIYIDLKNRNISPNVLSDFNNFMENQFNKIIEKNKYKINLNLKNKNNNIETYLNKLIDNNFSELKEITETMRLSPISPVAYSIKLLINSINKKNLISFIDIINNIILYSLLNKNIEIAYKNMLKDKNSDIEISYSRNSVPYLPPISKDREYTLVLDLDETLVHYFYSKVEVRGEPHYGYFSSDEEYGLFNNYLIDDKKENEKIDQNKYEYLKIGMFLLRPYAKQFLHELTKYYEISIFTTGTKEYCDRILQLLDLDNNLIKYRLYKHHIALKDINVSVKDLSLLGRDLSKTIIVDNLEENFRRQPDNGLPIITWKGDINDFSLKYLTTILKNIVINKVSDVRKVIKKIKIQIKSEKNPSYSKINPNTIF